MAHILCITSGLTGILHASFEMVARLEAAGHQVTCASPRAVGEKVTAQGFRFLQLKAQQIDLAPPLAKAKNPLQKVQRLWTKMRLAESRKQVALANLEMEAFTQILKEQTPDFLIIDVELHEHIMTAYAMQLPMTLLSQWFSLWKRPGLPPLLQDTIPGKTFRGNSLGLELAWWTIKCQRWWTFTKKKWLSAGTDRRSILLAYAKRVGFPLTYIQENYWPGPFTYGTLPVISITAQELEFPHSLRPNLHYVGPMVATNRKDTQTNDFLEQQLKNIFKESKTNEKALLYCSVSTFRKGDQGFLKKLIQAVATEDQWVMIVGMGGLLAKDTFGALPKNVYAFPWIPQLQVLEKAHCSINHGGIHTINECLHFKVPMLVYSGKRSDQNGCAARVDYHGVGMMADKDRDEVAVIRQKIKETLGNTSFRENLEKMHQKIKAYKKEERLVKTIEQWLSKNK